MERSSDLQQQRLIVIDGRDAGPAGHSQKGQQSPARPGKDGSFSYAHARSFTMGIVLWFRRPEICPLIARADNRFVEAFGLSMVVRIPDYPCLNLSPSH